MHQWDTGVACSAMHSPPCSEVVPEQMQTFFSRREALWWLGLAGCGSAVSAPKTFTLPDEVPSREVEPAPRFSDSVDALFDVLLPLEKLRPGAREVNVDAVMRTEGLVRLAIAQGFIAPMAETVVSALDQLATSARAALNRDLDFLASFEMPLTPFSRLPTATQIEVVARAFDDPLRRPTFLVIRAVCFLAYLGGGPSDLGLRALGYPKFENLSDGVAVSGYPRMTDGRVDDYTFNQQPPLTNGDDLRLVLTPDGDLL